MHLQYSIYRLSDGAIFINGETYDQQTLQSTIASYDSTMFGALMGRYSPATHCVVGGVPTPRLPLPYEISGTTLTNLPPGTELEFGGSTFQVEGTVAELEFDTPGTHTVTVRNAPRYLDATVEITV